MPTQTLGKVKLTPRGAYDPAAAYVPLDIVSYGGGSYCVLKNVTGVTPTGDDVNYQLLAESGADGKSPQISASKTWLVWDANKGEYVDTGVSAAGEKGGEGAPGKAPIIGSNGNWYEWDDAAGTYTDTGKPSRGADGATGATGEKGTDGKSAYQYAQDGGYTGTEAEFAAKLAAGSVLTTAQVNALDGMFKVAAYDDSKDVSGAYAAFKAAFGLADSGGTGGGGEEPPGVTTYTITAELVNVTSSNSATSITEGASYTATLTANDGYKLDTVSVLMGGTDVTADVYANGVISIPTVTGNVEIVASAIESEVTEALNTNGLVFNYDFRNSAMELYNLSGWGNVYRTVAQTGNAMIFGTTEATGDEKGLLGYDFRGNRLVSSETESVELGETYTAQALFRAGDTRVQPSLFGWGSNVVITNTFRISPKYLVGTTATSATEVQYSHEDTQYIVITYVASGKSLTVYHNTDLVLTLDGNNYDNFSKWMDSGVPNSIYHTGYITAFVGYNRALTQQEIIDNIAFFKTLEVTA